MNVTACVKRIPGTARLDPNSHTVERSGKLILDDSDRYGVEMALQLVEHAAGGEVTLISMAPTARSADCAPRSPWVPKAILVSDDSLTGSDACGTAKVPAAAIGRVPSDLVIAATESSDGYTGTVPVQLAEILGLPAITFATRVWVELGDAGSRVLVDRQTESGYDDVESPLPALVTVTAGTVEPRYPSFRGIMAAKSRPIEQLSVADLGLAADQVGWPGARRETIAVDSAETRQAGQIVVDQGDGHERIVAFLEHLKVI